MSSSAPSRTRRVRLWPGALLWLAIILAWQSIRYVGQSEDPGVIAQAHVSARQRAQAVVAQCAACHALTFRENRIGPTLVDISGKPAGSEPGFAYSDAMRASGLVWDRETLRRFLSDPQGTVPGTAMAISGVAPEDLQAVLDYLENK